MPALNIFETSFRRGKFDESRKLSNGGMLDFAHIYPMDAVFDTPEDVPEEVSQSNNSQTWSTITFAAAVVLRGTCMGTAATQDPTVRQLTRAALHGTQQMLGV